MITFRPATMDDADWLLSLRNDPLAREMSRNSGEVTPEVHRDWLDSHVEDPDCMILVALSDGVPVGTVRAVAIDGKYDDNFEVSIIIAPASRGAGLGKATLEAACERWNDRFLYAETKYNNIASHRIFGSCGFEVIGSYGLWIQWRRLPRA